VDCWWNGRRHSRRSRQLAKLGGKQQDPIDYSNFGLADGLLSDECAGGYPNMTTTKDGKLWVATLGGVAILDLSRLPPAAGKLFGIDPKILNEGARTGHWGLPGVRERAKLADAQLEFWSEVGAGTEVQVTVPGSVAYAKSPEARVLGLFHKKSRSHGE
jgi:hypothetical protein